MQEAAEQLQRELDTRSRLQAELRSSLQRESALQNEVQRLMSQQPEASSLSNGANGVRADSLQTQQLEAMAKRLELLAADKAAAEAAAAHAQQVQTVTGCSACDDRHMILSASVCLTLTSAGSWNLPLHHVSSFDSWGTHASELAYEGLIMRSAMWCVYLCVTEAKAMLLVCVATASAARECGRQQWRGA